MTEKSKYDNNYEIPISNDNNSENEELVEKDIDEQQQDSAEDQQQEQQQMSEERDYISMLKRLKAEFENYRKRVQKEKAELSDYVKSDLIGKLLPVIDDFERMFDNSQHLDETQLNANKLIYSKLISILENEGLEPIDAVGEEFDPEWHEAVVIEKGEEGEDNTVVEEWQKGYLFKSKLLRPAKVKVFKKE
jgi:molecular chaperone GrpE